MTDGWDDLSLAQLAKNPAMLKLNPVLEKYAGVKTTSKSKHHNVQTVLDGERYGSGLEAEHAGKFRLSVTHGENYLYIHHFNVRLPGGIRMELDHLIINAKMQIEIYETKATDVKTGKMLMTRDWKNKKKLFEETYKLKINMI